MSAPAGQCSPLAQPRHEAAGDRDEDGDPHEDGAGDANCQRDEEGVHG